MSSHLEGVVIGGSLVILICLNQHGCNIFLRWHLMRNIYLGRSKREVKNQVSKIFFPCCSALWVPEAAPVAQLIWPAPWTQFRGCHTLSGCEHTEQRQLAPVTKHKRNRKHQDEFFSSQRKDFMKHIKIAPKLLRRKLELNIAYSWKQIVHIDADTSQEEHKLVLFWHPSMSLVNKFL